MNKDILLFSSAVVVSVIGFILTQTDIFVALTLGTLILLCWSCVFEMILEK